MLNLITLNKEGRNKLKETFNLGDASISNYLNGRRNNPLAKKIRYTAISRYGGVEMIPLKKAKYFSK